MATTTEEKFNQQLVIAKLVLKENNTVLGPPTSGYMKGILLAYEQGYYIRKFRVVFLTFLFTNQGV